MATLIDNNSESLYYDYWYLGVYDPGEDCYPEMGQSFVAIDTYTELDSAKFYLTSYGTPPVGNIYSKIYASTGTHGVDALPTGSALATSDPVDSSLVTNTHPTYELYTFTFSGANRINLTSGTTYIIVVEYTEALTYANGIWAGFTDLQHAGNAASLFATWEVGGPWGSTNEDLIFYIYGTEYVPPVVDLPTYDRTSLEKGRFLQPIDINNLEEVSFIAGNTYHLDFPAYDENGNGLDISTGSCRWALSPYGEPNVVILQKEGVFTSTGSFRITLDAEDTRNLSGKFMHQASLRDWNGKRFIPSQGVITIVSSIPFEKASPEIYYVFPIADVGVRTANVAVWGENSIILVLIPDAVGYEVTYTVIIDGVTYTYTFTNAGDGVFYLLNPPNGDGTITVDGDYFWGAIVLYDVNQDYPFTVWDTINGDIVDTIIGDVVIDIILDGGGGDGEGLCITPVMGIPWDIDDWNVWGASCWSPYLEKFLVITYPYSEDRVNKVLMSSDGESWVQTEYGTTFDIYDVTWAGGTINKFVAVGQDYVSGVATIITSSNGTSWSVYPTSFQGSLSSVAYSPSLAMIVVGGGDGIKNVDGSYADRLVSIRSTNGANWTETYETHSDIVIRVYGIVWSPELGKFCELKSVWAGGTVYDYYSMLSSNGYSWSDNALPAPNREDYWNGAWTNIDWSSTLSLFAICETNNYYGADCIITSPDGINWQQRTTPEGAYYDIVAGGGIFVAVGWGGQYNDNMCVISTDGITWEEMYCPMESYFISYSITLSKFLISGMAWYASIESLALGEICGASICLDMAVAEGFPFSSPDNTGSFNNKVAYNPLTQEMFITGYDDAMNGGANIFTSPDGLVWTNHYQSSGPWPPDYYMWCSGFNKLIGTTYVSYGGDNVVLYSTDGVNWAYGTCLEDHIGINVISYSPELNLAIGFRTTNASTPSVPDSDFIEWKSTDGVAWESVIHEIDSTTPKYVRCATWSPELGIFCALRVTQSLTYPYYDTGTVYSMVSSDGVNWTEENSNIGLYQNRIITMIWSADLGLFISGSDAIEQYIKVGTIIISADGVGWIEVELPIGFRVWGIAAGNGIALAVGMTNEPGVRYAMLATSDGMNWQEIALPQSTSHEIQYAYDYAFNVSNVAYIEELNKFVINGQPYHYAIDAMCVAEICAITGSGEEESSNANGSIQSTVATSGTTTTSWSSGGDRIIVTVHPI